MENESLNIIWDWNGTLVDDVELCIEIMNSFLHERHLPLLNFERYRDVFDFPVIDYYKKLGFDFNVDPFEVIGLEFMKKFLDRIEEVPLMKDAVDILEWFSQQGYRQYILSAMEEKALIRMLTEKGIYHYFEAISGISNHYAGGKLEEGQHFIIQNNIKPDKTFLIGDTVHDFEVGNLLGIKVILITHGHQSKQRLLETQALVVDNFEQVKNWFIQMDK